jgi:stearoyl-CoA desaturase (delta-9 desaturase)
MFEWYYSLICIVLLQFTVAFVYSAYLHREVSHRLVKFQPSWIKFFRIFIWLIGFWWPNLWKTWATAHRKHHIFPDTDQDPNSPNVHSLYQILFHGGLPGEIYYIGAQDVEKYAKDVPQYNDGLERFFAKYPKWGVCALYAIFFVLFGLGGFIVFAVCYPVILISPRIHSIVTHRWGYRLRPALGTDQSRNSWPVFFFWWGEELNANHHDRPNSAKFSERWWEVDSIYGVLKILAYFDQVELIEE